MKKFVDIVPKLPRIVNKTADNQPQAARQSRVNNVCLCNISAKIWKYIIYNIKYEIWNFYPSPQTQFWINRLQIFRCSPTLPQIWFRYDAWNTDSRWWWNIPCAHGRTSRTFFNLSSKDAIWRKKCPLSKFSFGAFTFWGSFSQQTTINFATREIAKSQPNKKMNNLKMVEGMGATRQLSRNSKVYASLCRSGVR